MNQPIPLHRYTRPHFNVEMQVDGLLRDANRIIKDCQGHTMTMDNLFCLYEARLAIDLFLEQYFREVDHILFADNADREPM